MINKTVLLTAIIASILTFSGYRLMAQSTGDAAVSNLKDPKILIAYYSYSGHTKEVALAIQKEIGGDLFEIKTEGSYPEEYRQMTEQAQKEIQNGFRPKLLSQPDNIAQYDIVFLGSPVWWGTVTPQVSSFLETYNLSGKTVIPFITHGGGGVQKTVRDITSQCQGCTVQSNAWVGYGSRTFGISGWLKDMGFKK